ncbi:histidine phosphatase family protein [Aliihoeflea sp. 40Bstr573]|uniref:SixA phosphatase family protein n=1 Tax=Aliihoeflea sp. 40Bstr573 TaxID=2696467 RepID=UPI00209510DD|nr:histidine phosphatase family protein [Aliihoeflea sp. 40Bstr573]MCO6385721.1 histidine phosphatase family protein [Aliihoeflea sp. 40Bstr573]
MPRLYLLRHAKARWAEPGQRDFDRSLDASGVADAKKLGAYLRENERRPERIAASSSSRTRETVAALGDLTPEGKITYLDSLYEATAVQALDILHEQAGAGDLMVVGHNPVMEDLASALVGKDAKALRAGFPTCGLAVIAFDGALSAAQPGTGRLELFWTPSGVK